MYLLYLRIIKNPEYFFENEPKSGQGWKGQVIRSSYLDFREFSIGKTMDVNIVLRIQLFLKNYYINWNETNLSIRTHWNVNEEDEEQDWIEEPNLIKPFGLNDRLPSISH